MNLNNYQSSKLSTGTQAKSLTPWILTNSSSRRAKFSANCTSTSRNLLILVWFQDKSLCQCFPHCICKYSLMIPSLTCVLPPAQRLHKCWKWFRKRENIWVMVVSLLTMLITQEPKCWSIKSTDQELQVLPLSIIQVSFCQNFTTTKSTILKINSNLTRFYAMFRVQETALLVRSQLNGPNGIPVMAMCFIHCNCRF